MLEDGRNIYKTCRELAGFTQNHAAELLGGPVQALARYERGKRPDEREQVELESKILPILKPMAGFTIEVRLSAGCSS